MTAQIPFIDIYPAFAQRKASAKGLRKYWYQMLPIPLHVWLPLRMEIHLAWIRMTRHRRAVRHFHRAENLLVNLGCGATGRAGWVNIDAYQAPGVNCVYDCRMQLPFADSSVKGIFCEHFFEFLDYTEHVPYFISECYRVLQPGGVLRLIVPDAEQYLHAYIAPGWEAMQSLRNLDEQNQDPSYKFHYNTKLELVNMVFRTGYLHKYAYDYETLAFVLERYGFSTVKKQCCGQSFIEELCIDQERRSSESLYVEAKK